MIKVCVFNKSNDVSICIRSHSRLADMVTEIAHFERGTQI